MTTDLQQAAARVQELVDIWEKGQIEVYPVITLNPPTIKDCLRTLLGAVEEIERLRAENKRLLEENCDWHSCVNTSITMSGPVFTGGNLSGLTRCFERYIRKAALTDQTGGEG